MQRIGPDVAELKRMYVRPEHRNGGLGQALVDRLIVMVRGAGYSRIELDSPDFMTAAHRLYRARGFIDVGPYPGTGIPNACGLDGCSWSERSVPSLGAEAHLGNRLNSPSKSAGRLPLELGRLTFATCWGTDGAFLSR